MTNKKKDSPKYDTNLTILKNNMTENKPKFLPDKKTEYQNSNRENGVYFVFFSTISKTIYKLYFLQKRKNKMLLLKISSENLFSQFKIH